MAKHIAPPATAEQIRRTLGVSRSDMEIVERLLQEIGEYDLPPSEGSFENRRSENAGHDANLS
jgi:hypothetical protein